MDETTTEIRQCRRMGYMLMKREDGTMHHQPFLVNTSATDCIMLPDEITQQVPDGINRRQQGHVGTEPGTLALFDVRGMWILRLCLNKRGNLYYCNIGENKGGNTTEDTQYNRFTEDWVREIDKDNEGNLKPLRPG